MPSDSYKLLTFVKSDFNCPIFTFDLELGVSPAKEMCQGNEKLLMGMFLKGNICQTKWAGGEKTLQDGKRLPWVHTEWPA